MNTKDAAVAIDFFNEYWKQIVDKWISFHVYHQIVKNTKINKRIRKGKDNGQD